jgi:predicted DNA-binding transcriptional regulator AlpA
MQSSPDSLSEFVSDAELARRLGLSPATLQKWRSQAKGPRWVRMGRAIRYRVSDVEAWVNAQTVGGEA